MRSLKHTLIRRVVMSVVVLTAIAGVSFYFVARAYLLERFDDEIEEHFEMLAASIELENRAIDFEMDDFEMDDFGEEEDDDDDDEDEEDDDDEEEPLSYLLITSAKGTVYRSPTLGADGTLWDQPTEDPRWIMLPNGRRGRVYTQSFVPEPDLDDPLFEWVEDAMALGDYGEEYRVTMSMARETTRVDAALSLLGIGLAAAGGVLAILMSIVVGYGVRRSLRPVAELTDRLAVVDEHHLARPIEAGPLPGELEPIVARYHDLLARVAHAYERERGFSADAAHELRTPLAGLRTTLEVALAQPRPPEQSAQVFTELLEVTGHMRTLVEALLQLAKLDANGTDDASGRVTLDDEIERVWRLVISNGVSSRVFETRRDLNADAPIATRPGLLETVLRNVLHNAAEYVDEHGTVTLATELTETHARIVVSNTGSTVSPNDAAHVFDRFWRNDAARAGTGKHAGLGLALTRAAVQALGGTIYARSEIGERFVITIELPREPSARAK